MGYLDISRTVERVDAAHVRIGNPYGIPISLFAGTDVPIEKAAVEQLLSFASLSETLVDLNRHRFFGDVRGEIARIVLTPDFHRGSGIPVGTVVDARGFVVPKAIGNDVCCGMRLLVTDLPAEALTAHRPAVARRLRALFFGGERDIPMSPRQREAVLRSGLSGLSDTAADNATCGIWRHFDAEGARDDLARVHQGGSFATRGLFGFEGFVRSSGRIDGRGPADRLGGWWQPLRRAAIGGRAPRRLGGAPLGRLPGQPGHHGALGLGGHRSCGGRSLHGRGTRRVPARAPPEARLLPAGHGWPFLASRRRTWMPCTKQPTRGSPNRLLGLAALRAIREATGRSVSAKLVYDAPHNLVFPGDDGESFLHRKGATPAGGPASPDAWIGEPVIIPGSMGASSFLLAGAGQPASLCSACHGAGRALSRGAATDVDPAKADRALAELEVVTSIDPAAPHLRTRQDVLEKHRQRVLEEPPTPTRDIQARFEPCKMHVSPRRWHVFRRFSR